MESFSRLAAALEKPSYRSRSRSQDAELTSQFRAAALAITQLLKTAQSSASAAYESGYSDALSDVLDVLQSGLDMQDSSSLATLFNWIEARQESLRDESSENDDEDVPIPPRPNSNNSNNNNNSVPPEPSRRKSPPPSSPLTSTASIPTITHTAPTPTMPAPSLYPVPSTSASAAPFAASSSAKARLGQRKPNQRQTNRVADTSMTSDESVVAPIVGHKRKTWSPEIVSIDPSLSLSLRSTSSSEETVMHDVSMGERPAKRTARR